jgi:hypothetical protein
MRALRFLSFAAVLFVPALFIADGRSTPPPFQSKQDDAKKEPEKNPAPQPDPADEEILRKADIATDGPKLLEFLKKRTLPESERPELLRLVGRLGAGDYRTRETAMRALTARGVAALDVLRSSPRDVLDIEQMRRLERSIRTIRESDVGPHVVAAAVRVASPRNPKGIVESLLAYLPFADDESVVDEMRAALTKLAVTEGKADPAVLTALKDRSAIRRAIAAEALARSVYRDHKDAIKKTLSDADPMVRFRVAKALALVQERDAIPVLIDSIPDLSLNAAWQAEDFLLRLAAKDAPDAPMSKEMETRVKCRDAWQAWWKANGTKADLAKLEDTPKMLGRTLVVHLDDNTVLELGPDNRPRWQITNINFPLDAQLIGEDRVLVAEHHASRVSERTLRGDMVWQRQIIGPLAAQRLANGNTFIATDHQLLEYDKTGGQVVNITFPEEGRKIMKAAKLDSGEIVCMLADARIVRFDTRGTEVSSFNIPLGQRLYGGRIHMLPTGRVLVPFNSDGKVVEYDGKGRAVWEVSVPQPIAAMRLLNGNTLITSMDASVGALEVDRAGVTVWTYQNPSGTRVTRAFRR